VNKCDCCKRQMHRVDTDGLCLVCLGIHSFTAVIKERTELNANDSLDLAIDLMEKLQSAILEWLVDERGLSTEFVADIGRGMVRQSQH
jgi:hypothetical protein